MACSPVGAVQPDWPHLPGALGALTTDVHTDLPASWRQVAAADDGEMALTPRVEIQEASLFCN